MYYHICEVHWYYYSGSNSTHTASDGSAPIGADTSLSVIERAKEKHPPRVQKDIRKTALGTHANSIDSSMRKVTLSPGH